LRDGIVSAFGCLPLFGHALFPSGFRLQVNPMTQKPSSEFLLTVSGIQHPVPRRTRFDACSSSISQRTSEWTKTETLEFPGSVEGPWKRYVHDANARGIGTVRFPRTVAKDSGCDAKLKKRTLTNLYNEMPTWLKNAHAALDAGVFAAYGWQPDLTDEEILARLLDMNQTQAANPRSASGP
jgi:hypothetical protein